MNTAKEILRKMRDEMPYALPDVMVPYIIEAIELHTDLATKALQEENRQLKERAEKMAKALDELSRFSGNSNNQFLKYVNSVSTKALTAYQTNNVG